MEILIANYVDVMIRCPGQTWAYVDFKEIQASFCIVSHSFVLFGSWLVSSYYAFFCLPTYIPYDTSSYCTTCWPSPDGSMKGCGRGVMWLWLPGPSSRTASIQPSPSTTIHTQLLLPCRTYHCTAASWKFLVVGLHRDSGGKCSALEPQNKHSRT